MEYTFTSSFGNTFSSRVTPQAARVLNLMARDGHVTRLTLAHYGIANPTARFAELRLDHGVSVECERCVDALGRRYSRWSLDGAQTHQAEQLIATATAQ